MAKMFNIKYKEYENLLPYQRKYRATMQDIIVQ